MRVPVELMIEVFSHANNVTEILLYELILQAADPAVVTQPHPGKFFIYLKSGSDERVVRFLDGLRLYGSPLRARLATRAESLKLIIKTRGAPPRQLILQVANLPGANVHTVGSSVFALFREFEQYESALSVAREWLGKMSVTHVQ